MARRKTHYYLVKIVRLSGWLLLPLMVMYLGTGFALCGMFGFDNFVNYQTALFVHRLFDWPLIGAFLVHATLTVYFAMRRWGWIKRRKCP